MNRTITASVAACALGIAGNFANAQPQIIISPRLAYEAAQAAEAAREASLRAEANASYLSPRALRRTAIAQANIRAREDAEIAAYEQFKFEQQLAMAEASAPKVYILNGNTPLDNSLGAAPSKASTARPASFRRTTMIPRSAGDLRGSTTVPRYFSRAYPNRFYRKQAQERGADRLIEHIQRQDEINSRQQQWIPTENGYIDVSGYRSGDMARDPYTGETFRVP